MQHRWVGLILAWHLGITPALAGVLELRWPETNPSATCHGRTLQQCLDAAPAQSRVRVVRGLGSGGDYHPIASSLTISRSLELVVDPGVDLVLAAGADVVFQPAIGSSGSVHIEGVVLSAGRIRVGATGAVPGVVRILRNRIGLRADAFDDSAIAIEIHSAEPGSWQLEVEENVLYSTGVSGANGIFITQSNAGTHQTTVTVRDNLIESRHEEGMRNGIFVSLARSPRIAVERNLVRGSTDIDATSGPIALSLIGSGLSTEVRIADNWVQARPDATGAGIRVLSGTHTPRIRVVNNSVVQGRVGVQVEVRRSGAEVDIHNNLVIGQRQLGLALDVLEGATPTVRNRRNALYANAQNALGISLDPSTVTDDPKLERRDFPQPKADSPLRDQGDFFAWQAGAGTARQDVTGERRDRGTGIDIGAFEWNDDRVFRHTSSADNTVSNYSVIAERRLDDGDLPLITPLSAAISAEEAGQHLGIWRPGGVRYAIFHQQIGQSMSLGRSFVVGRFRPVPEVSSIYDTMAGTVDGACARLPLPSDSPLVAIATHRYEGPGGNLSYFAEPFGVRYQAVPGWLLCTESGAPMPSNLRFHLVVARAPFKFNGFTTPGLDEPRSRVALRHRLLDDQGCALPLVGRGQDLTVPSPPVNPRALVLRFDLPTGSGAPQRWSVLSVGGLFPERSAFNVLLSGSQALRCRADAELIKDGFD